MAEIHDDLERGPLAGRLRSLDVAATDAVPERAPAGDRRRPRAWGRRRWVMATAVAAGLAAVLALSSIAEAVRTPIAESMLRWLGVPASKTSSLGTGQHVSTTVGGRTITLVGVYADSLHTVLLLHSDPAMPVPGTPVVLRDEHGREVAERTGSYTPPNGDMAYGYQGLPPGLHEVTVTVESVPPGTQWVLRFPLTVSSAQQPVANPLSGSLHGVKVTVKQAGGGRDFITTTLETTGATGDQLSEQPNEAEEARGATRGPDPMTIRLFGPAGQELKVVNGGGGGVAPAADGLGKGHDYTDILWESDWPGAGPGTYRLLATYKGARFESTFTIH
jgi:hypothetical protein